MGDPLLVSVIDGCKRTNFRVHWGIGPGRMGEMLLPLLSSIQRQTERRANAVKALLAAIGEWEVYRHEKPMASERGKQEIMGDWDRAILFRYEGAHGHSGAGDMHWSIGWVASCDGEMDERLDALAHWRSVESFRAYSAMHKVLEKAHQEADLFMGEVQAF